jgi:agmatine/peptidylarginine deiminase
MKNKYLVLSALLLSNTFFAQELPKGWGPGEEAKMPAYLESIKSQNKSSVITTPPPYKGLRNAAEWEEIQTLNITWTSYTSIHREIIKAAQPETKITIICSDSNTVKNNLISNSVPLTNVRYLQTPFNSIWARDYSGNTVYSKNVDSLLLVDWIYNRPRPLDDVTPTALANFIGIPIYETKTAPYDLVHTGGNYMSDGFGTAFSSQLTDNENTSKTAAQIDAIMKLFMGVTRYIRFPVLPYDGIHHIDMHMKLLDEETLLVGEYPTGVADGPQIEANLQYILTNYNSVFGTPYKVVRIPMPKDKNNKWPSQSGGWYCTYTNGVFVNKTYIFPTFYQQYDTTAYRILTQSLPGYKVVGIDCDNGTSPIISQSGAIHCITHCVGVNDPLLISHQRLTNKCDTGSYQIKARVMHKSGIASAQVFWTTDTTVAYQTANMTLTNASTDEYTANIPFQAAGQTVYYYISASSTSGKTMVRPITAPLGRWTFKINSCAVAQSIKENSVIKAKPVYPNPASGITCIPITSNSTQHVKVNLRNTLGQLVDVVYDGQVDAGEKNVFLFADKYSKGAYMIEIISGTSVSVQKLIIK